MTHILCEKYQEHLLWPDLRDSKNFENLCLAKLQTAITFASGIRTTIIIYAFGVENNFPYYDNGFCRLGSPKLQKIICLFDSGTTSIKFGAVAGE